jgi:hypothetical protein
MATDNANERTPLLHDVPPEPINDGAVEQQQAALDAQAQEDETTRAQEVTGKKLVVILASVYLGVFLGALGIDTNVRVLGLC